MKKKSFTLSSVALLMLLFINAYSQAPVSFSVNPHLYAYTAFGYAQQGITKMVTASDGSIIAAGFFTDPANPDCAFKVLKYDAAGNFVAEYVDHNPDYTTANGAGSAGYNYSVNDMVIDAGDNVYLLGPQNDTITVGTTLYKGVRCIVKLNAAMNLVWKKKSPVNNWLSMILDGNGNLIVNGTTKNKSNGNGTNIVTYKYNAQGNKLWWKFYLSQVPNSNDIGNDVSVDASNNIYVTGQRGTATRGTGVITIKYDANGNLLWHKTFDLVKTGAYSDQGVSIVAGPTGNCYVLAACTKSNNRSYPCILKYNPNGILEWKKIFSRLLGNTKYFYPVKIRIDADENVYAGTYIISFYTGPVAEIYKYRTNGDSIRVITKDSITLADFDVTPNGLVYLTGSNSPYGQFGSNGIIQTEKYDSSGILIWNDRYTDYFVPNQTFYPRGWVSCISVNPNNPDAITIGGGASAKDNVTGIYNAAGLIRNFKSGTPRFANQDNKLDFNFSVNPNPAKDFMIITSAGNEYIHWVILNSIGAEVKNGILKSSEEQISVEDLKTGIYFIRLSDNRDYQTRKFIKQ